jgi:hypothetical protein
LSLVIGAAGRLQRRHHQSVAAPATSLSRNSWGYQGT